MCSWYDFGCASFKCREDAIGRIPVLEWVQIVAEIVFSPEEDERTGSCTGEVSASISGSLLEVISNARARLTKLEAAMAAVWESNATFSAPQEALKKAQEQAQVRLVEDRIASTEVIHRACEEAGQFVRRRSRPRAGGPFEGTDETSVRRARVDRGRHEWRHSSRRPWDESGGAASHRTCRFCKRVGRVSVLGRRVVTGNHDLRSQLQSGGPSAEERTRQQSGICQIPLSIWCS